VDVDLRKGPLPVRAAAAGIVRYAGSFGSGWGDCVILEHQVPGPGLVTTLYGHIKIADGVAPGAIRNRGDQLGTIDQNVQPPHLHFGVRLGAYDLGRSIPGALCPSCEPRFPDAWTDPEVFLTEHASPPVPATPSSETARLRLVGLDGSGQRHNDFLEKYYTGYCMDKRSTNVDPLPFGENQIGYPHDDQYFPGARVCRHANGLLQTFRRSDGQPTALMRCDGSTQVIWVHGAMWATYSSRGGPGVFGYPLTEEYDVPEGRGQRFERATFVWNSHTGSTDVR